MLAKLPHICKVCLAAKSVRHDAGKLAQERDTAYPFIRVCAGPLATVSRELRQAWKGAAVTVMPGAGVWLA